MSSRQGKRTPEKIKASLDRPSLSPQETILLMRILAGKGNIVPYSEIEHALWGHKDDGGPYFTKEAIHIRVCRLRRVIPEITIVNHRSLGFSIDKSCVIPERVKEIDHRLLNKWLDENS